MSVTKLDRQKGDLKPSWTPRNYQKIAASFLINNKYSGLFLDPGLGKTSTSLSIIKMLRSLNKIKGVLLIAPLRVCYSVWPEEINKWENFKNITHTILHGKTKPTLYGEQKDIYLMNPEGLPWLLEELLDMVNNNEPIPFDTLWIDESTKFKSPTAKTRFKTIASMLSLFKRRHIMTGTPAPRSLMDLWSQIYILDKGVALKENFYHFRNKYFYKNEYNEYQYLLKDGAADEIQKSVSHLVLEMSSKDYLELPDLINNYINVELPVKAMKLYKEMEREFFIELDDKEVSASQTAIASMKCHQIANGYVYEDLPDDEEAAKDFLRESILVHKAKQEAIKELVEELNGKPLLIAYNFKHDLTALRTCFGADLPYIGSGVGGSQTKATVELWNAGKIPILAGHPSSMGHGLNMQASGNDICWYSMTWNLEEYLQFNARIYRQGVSGHVRIHHLIAKNTIDEAMKIRLDERDKDQKDLREAIKQYRRSKK